MPTIKEVADRAGVSRATVSRVLSGKQSVDPRLAERVQQAVRELNFRPDRIATALARGRANIICLIIPDIRNPFYAEIARGVEDLGYEAGFTVLLANADDDETKEAMYLGLAREHRAAGVIISPIGSPSRLEKELPSLGCPTVFVNRFPEISGYDSVLLDNFRGGYLATRHLLELGHRRIAHLAGPESSSASESRFRGYRSALEEHGIPFTPDLVQRGNLRAESGRRFAQHLLETGFSATAVFAANDQMAVGIMETLAEHKRGVPDFLSLVGFDDTPLASLWSIGLTTVRQPQYEMGEAAANLLLQRVRGGRGVPRQVVFAPELIRRASTRRIETASE